MSVRIRLNRYLALCGCGSRRSCDELIAEGRVTVNGVPVTSMGTSVSPEDVVTVDGRSVKPAKKSRYYALYKPAGVLTTTKDPFRRKIITQLLPPWLRDMKPVGRLDRDTEGLLLITDDGAFAQKVAHPSAGVVKRYEIIVKGRVKPEDAAALEAGIPLPDGYVGRGVVKGITYNNGRTTVVLEVTYGRKRMIRRMFGALGYKIEVLRRTAVGPVELGDLAPGKYRPLTEPEVEGLLGE